MAIASHGKQLFICQVIWFGQLLQLVLRFFGNEAQFLKNFGLRANRRVHFLGFAHRLLISCLILALARIIKHSSNFCEVFQCVLYHQIIFLFDI